MPTKKKLNSYMRFVIEQRPLLVSSNPRLSVTEIASQLGKMWRELGDAEKQKYK